MTNAFDLSAFDSVVTAQEAGIDVEILGPDGKPIGDDGFSIKIAGPDSQRQRKAIQEIQDERLAAEDGSPLTAKQAEENGLRVLAKSTISWSPVKLDGAELSCTEENAIKLYSRYPFIREQIERKAGRRSAFTKRSATSSVTPSGEGTAGSQP